MPLYHHRKGKPFQSILSPNNLTSNTSNPEWELLSDSVFSSSYPMYKAFDGKPGGYLDGWLSAEVSGDHWLGIRHVGSPVRVTEYGFYPAWSGGNDAPKTWVFQGSHNGTVWETLDSQADVSVPMESKEYRYTLASPAEYEYYRLYVTANQGGHTYLAIGEFILYGGLMYPTSSGFDDFGYPIAYDTASEAECAYSALPKEGLLFYAPLSEQKDAAETGQAFEVHGTLTYQEYQGIPCVYCNSSYLYFPDTGFPTGNQPFTLSAWVNVAGNAGSYNCFFGWGTAGSSKLATLVYHKSGTLGISFYADESSMYTPVKGLSVWQHVLVTFDGTTVNVYFDGVLAGTRDKTNCAITLNRGSIGRSPADRDSANCYVAACRIYNRALEDKEIQQLAGEFDV